MMVLVPPEGNFLVPARKLPKKPAGEGLNAIAPAIEPPPQTPPGDASPGVLVYMVPFKKRYNAIGAVSLNWLGDGRLCFSLSVTLLLLPRFPLMRLDVSGTALKQGLFDRLNHAPKKSGRGLLLQCFHCRLDLRIFRRVKDSGIDPVRGLLVHLHAN